MIGLLRDLARAADRNRLTGLAAELTFFAVFSLFPGLLIVAGALGSLERLLGHDIAALSKAEVLEFLDQILTEKARPLIEAVRDLFDSGGGGLITLGAALGLFSMSTGFAALIEALDIVYGVAERRSWARIRILALGLALVSVAMVAIVLAFVVVGPLFWRGESLAGLIGMGAVFSFAWDWLRPPLTLALLTCWVTTLYWIAPGRPTRWTQELPGGTLAAAMLVAVSYGFRLYLSLAATTNKILGVLGGWLNLMIWLYALSLSVLLGATLNTVIRRAQHR